MKRLKRMDLGDMFLATLLGGMGVVTVGTLSNLEPPVPPASVQPAKVSVEEARFMLECTQDWGLSGEECQAVLRGENPPAFDGNYCGC